MKNKKVFKSGLRLLCIAGLLSFMSSCELDKAIDPNNPDANNIENNASLSEIQNLVDGIESWMRDRLGTYLDGVGVIGREYYRFSASDPRFTADLLGKGSAILDNNTFYTTRTFQSRYRVIKNANILLTALDNTSAPISDADKDAARGYAKTIQAYQYLSVAMRQYTCGVRFDVSDPDNLGPYLDFSASLNAITALLDEGLADLQSGGEFPFNLNSGYDGFDTPANFAEYNRALAARTALYRSDWNGVKTALNGSFMNLNGDLYTGVYHPFSTAGGDQLNPMWFPFDEPAETRVAHNSYVADADPGDDRVNKVRERTSEAFQDGLSSNYDLNIYASNADPLPIIRNEELILMQAEADIQLGNSSDAITAIDKIRMAHGQDPYSGGNGMTELIDELLYQRRYSLFGEGHRWYDMRRYDKLGDLPIDRAGDDVWIGFPRPQTENEPCNPN